MKTPFSNIVVPIDGSATSRRGIEYAIELAADGAALHFCSVVSTAVVGAGLAAGVPVSAGALIAAAEADARTACSEAIAMAGKCGVEADDKLLYGAIAPAICRYAAELAADAIVIGTHARHGIARAIFGSVTEALLTSSTVPVVVAHTDDALQNGGPITVAIDDTLPSRAALQVGVDLALASGVGIVIETVTGSERSEWRDAAELLSEAADVVRDADIDFELVTKTGRPANEIVDDGERRLSSAIVVGTGHRSAIARLVSGSVAALVLERARIPVIAVPA